MAATSALLEPEMPENTAMATTMTTLRPPRTRPHTRSRKATRRTDMPFTPHHQPGKHEERDGQQHVVADTRLHLLGKLHHGQDAGDRDVDQTAGRKGKRHGHGGGPDMPRPPPAWPRCRPPGVAGARVAPQHGEHCCAGRGNPGHQRGARRHAHEMEERQKPSSRRRPRAPASNRRWPAAGRWAWSGLRHYPAAGPRPR